MEKLDLKKELTRCLLDNKYEKLIKEWVKNNENIDDEILEMSYFVNSYIDYYNLVEKADFFVKKGLKINEFCDILNQIGIDKFSDFNVSVISFFWKGFNGNIKNKNSRFYFDNSSRILQRCGFNNEFSFSFDFHKFIENQHTINRTFNVFDILDLDEKLVAPIAVFETGNENRWNVIVYSSKNYNSLAFFCIEIILNKNHYEVNAVSKFVGMETVRLLEWIDQGALIYCEKKEMLDIISNFEVLQKDMFNSQFFSETFFCQNSFYISSVEKILESFGVGEHVFTSNSIQYVKYKQKYLIFKRFENVYFRENSFSFYSHLAKYQCEEFFKALENCDSSVLRKYLFPDADNSQFYIHEIAKVARQIVKEVSGYEDSVKNEMDFFHAFKILEERKRASVNSKCCIPYFVF